MRFLQLGRTGVSEVHVDDEQVLCAHRAVVQVTADPSTGSHNGLSLILQGHMSTPDRTPGASVTLLDARTAAQLVLGIEAAVCDASADIQREFLAHIAHQRGGH